MPRKKREDMIIDKLLERRSLIIDVGVNIERWMSKAENVERYNLWRSDPDTVLFIGMALHGNIPSVFINQAYTRDVAQALDAGAWAFAERLMNLQSVIEDVELMEIPERKGKGTNG